MQLTLLLPSPLQYIVMGSSSTTLASLFLFLEITGSRVFLWKVGLVSKTVEPLHFYIKHLKHSALQPCTDPDPSQQPPHPVAG